MTVMNVCDTRRRVSPNCGSRAALVWRPAVLRVCLQSVAGIVSGMGTGRFPFKSFPVYHSSASRLAVYSTVLFELQSASLNTLQIKISTFRKSAVAGR